ncbi:MAG TPA: hypothetical protein VGI48_14080 [Caldimonas sp.]|jgi:hypothetical protein
MSSYRFRALCTAPMMLCAATMPSTARAETDACTVLTAAQVGDAVGTPVAAGEHVTPTFVKTCTWKASGGSAVKAVTLNLQTAAFYDGSKKMAREMAAAGKGGSLKSAGVGDDSYYFVTGDQPVLMVKKGNVSVRVAVYAKLPADKTEAMELTLAKDAVAKL